MQILLLRISSHAKQIHYRNGTVHGLLVGDDYLHIYHQKVVGDYYPDWIPLASAQVAV
jgi:hypothetical protein